MPRALPNPDPTPSADFAELWPVEDVTPYRNNPRRNANAVEPVMESIRAFGFRQPVVVDEAGVVIVGHTRLEAAKRLGMTHVPVHIARGLSKAQAKAYRLADNRTNENAEWDRTLLAVELNDLRLDDYDVLLTGFSEQEMEGILGEAMDLAGEGGDDFDKVDEETVETSHQCPSCGYEWSGKAK